MSVDKKYTGVITKADGTIVDDWIVFRAKDAAVLPTLNYYAVTCEALGADQAHVAGIYTLIERVKAFQKKYPDRVKVPDTFEDDMVFNAVE